MKVDTRQRKKARKGFAQVRRRGARSENGSRPPDRKERIGFACRGARTHARGDDHGYGAGGGRALNRNCGIENSSESFTPLPYREWFRKHLTDTCRLRPVVRERLSGVPLITTTGMVGRTDLILSAISSPLISGHEICKDEIKFLRVLDDGPDGLLAALLYFHLVVYRRKHLVYELPKEVLVVLSFLLRGLEKSSGRADVFSGFKGAGQRAA